jgi:hypothetical protein
MFPAGTLNLYDQILGAETRLVTVKLETRCLLNPEIFSAVFDCLKVIQVLQRIIFLNSVPRECFAELKKLEAVLLHHNFTVRELRISNNRHPRRRRVNKLLGLDVFVRGSVDLQLLPQVAERAGCLPSLLYRLLRRGTSGPWSTT